MANYSTIDLVKGKAFQDCPADEAPLTALLPAASRYIDRLCHVPDNFFAPAGGAKTAKVFEGDGLAYLWLPPYVGTVTEADITLEHGGEKPAFRASQGFLIAKQGGCWPDEEITIQADWGFAAVPDEIAQATAELILQLWRTEDPAKERAVADTTGIAIDERRISPRIKAVCEAWKRKTRWVLA